MSATALVLAVIIVILLYLLFKKYASNPSSTSEVGTNTELSTEKVRDEKKAISEGVNTGSIVGAANKGANVTSCARPEPDVTTARRPSNQELKKVGSGSNSKEWGPFGNQKMRKVPPWKFEGEAKYPPNFWVEAQRR